MKYLDAYKDPREARDLIDRIGRAASRPWTLMEVCGGQTQNFLRFGIDRALPAGLEVLHGPSCPICATPAAAVDHALSIAERPGVIVGATGDLLRVPGRLRGETLLTARERGADVRVIYTPIDALALARKHPDRQVVAVAIGFETTAPAAAATLIEADRLGLDNLALLTSFYRLAPAVEAILAHPGNRARAVLASGPVCAVNGIHEYARLAERFRIPVVITGPEPLDLLDAIARAVLQLERGEATLENQYARAVRPDGNPQAREAIDRVFEPADASWRDFGRLPNSGLVFKPPFQRFDAAARFPMDGLRPVAAVAECRVGEILTGRLKPFECREFGTGCTPDHPLGAAMVSVEGTCAAYYRYRRSAVETPTSPALNVLQPQTIPGG